MECWIHFWKMNIRKYDIFMVMFRFTFLFSFHYWPFNSFVLFFWMQKFWLTFSFPRLKSSYSIYKYISCTWMYILLYAHIRTFPRWKLHYFKCFGEILLQYFLLHFFRSFSCCCDENVSKENEVLECITLLWWCVKSWYEK